MSLGQIATKIGRTAETVQSTDVVDIIEFAEAKWGLGMRLFPVQRVILKAHYGLALDNNPHGFDLTKPIPQNHPDYQDLVDMMPMSATNKIEIVEPSEIPDDASIVLTDPSGTRHQLDNGTHWFSTGSETDVLESIAAAIQRFVPAEFEADVNYGALQVVITSKAFSVEGNKARLDLTLCEGFQVGLPDLEFDQEGWEPQGHRFYGGMGGFYKFRVMITDWRRENPKIFTEAQYLRYLYDNKRSNIPAVIPGKERREMILSVGRRAGKTTLSAAIAAYETYKLIKKGHPQSYYGLPDSNVIQIISIATDKDQAGLLYREVHGHFVECDYFGAYMANATQTFATFQTPRDIEKFGSYKDNQKARVSIKVTFRACVAKGLRGAGNIVVILDEVAHFTDDGQSSAEQVYNAVTPSTSAFSRKDPNDSRRPTGAVEGRIILISSPLGKQGQFYKLFQIGMRGGPAAENMLCIEAPSWEVNPTIPMSEYAKHYAKDPRVFFTEYGGQFTDRTLGWIEDKKDLLDCVVEGQRPAHKAPPLMPHYLGLDIALAKGGDYVAAAITHLDQQQNVVLDVVERIRAGEGDYVHRERLEHDDVVEWVWDLSKRFYISEGMFDQWSGIVFEQLFAKRGLRQLETVHHTKSLNSQMFQNFKDMMFARRLQLYDWPRPDDPLHGEHCSYIEELLSLQAEVVSKYVVEVSAPDLEGKHDDQADAIVRSVWLATQKAKAPISFGTQIDSRGQVRRSPSAAAMAKARMKARLGGSHPDRMIVRPGMFRGGGRGGRGGLGGLGGGGWRR